jgi:TolA-binding protein
VSGVLSIRVDHALSQRRLLVILPDGELEDMGTTFSVSANAEQTTHVTVQEGSIVLRLRGNPPLSLGAGEAWRPSPTATLVPAPASAPRARTPRVKTMPLGVPAASSDALARSDAAHADAAADFRAAMAAFNAGNHARAAADFAAFLRQHPQDSHAEDAAYLRILALQRTGDSVATKQAAQDYLSRYSHGFRHAEVEAISHD